MIETGTSVRQDAHLLSLIAYKKAPGAAEAFFVCCCAIKKEWPNMAGHSFFAFYK